MTRKIHLKYYIILYSYSCYFSMLLILSPKLLSSCAHRDCAVLLFTIEELKNIKASHSTVPYKDVNPSVESKNHTTLTNTYNTQAQRPSLGSESGVEDPETHITRKIKRPDYYKHPYRLYKILSGAGIKIPINQKTPFLVLSLKLKKYFFCIWTLLVSYTSIYISIHKYV